MGAELRWAVISTADIGLKKVIPGFQQAPRTRIVAIASRDRARAVDAAERFGIPRAYGSYEEVLADAEVDAVYIPLPNHMHLEWTLAAAAAGKHVLCEKPLALTSADAAVMVEACERAGVVLMEAFMYRLHPSWAATWRLVAEGRIGRLVAATSWFSYYNDDPLNIRNILHAGGGALYDIGCYCVDLSRQLFGGGEPSSVSAAIVRDPLGGTDTVTSALLEFEGGLASFTCSTRAQPDQRVDIYGTQGRISIPIPFNIPPDQPTEVIVASGGPSARIVDRLVFETADPYTVEAEVFAAAVLDGVDPPFASRDAVVNLRVIERIFEAAAGD